MANDVHKQAQENTFMTKPRSFLSIAALAAQCTVLVFAQESTPPQATSRDGFGRITQAQPIPAQITIPAGAWLSVRINQGLSTKRNTVGDTFTASLSQPLVADGMVLARRGQMVSGRVVEVERAGRVKGPSRLGIELTEISLVDGQQLPVRTQLVETRGGSSNGRDVGAVAGTTAAGAAIGGAAAGGSGAGLGAIAGAGAAVIGVLATRGRDTEIYPEETIAFRTLAPVSVSTERSGQAFQSVQQDDFSPNQNFQPRVTRPATLPGPANFIAGGFYSPNYWGNYWGPGFFGPGLGLYYSPRFYGGGFGRGGFGRGGFGRGGFGRRW
jgi:hypothetical protein